MYYYVIGNGCGLYYSCTKGKIRVFENNVSYAHHYFNLANARKMCDKLGYGAKVFKVDCITLNKQEIYFKLNND